MPEQVDLKEAISLDPEAAIRYFRQKGYTISWNWQETLQEANARAFTVAKMANLELLKTVNEKLDTVISEGKTERWFAKELTPLLQQAGWWGRPLSVGPEGQAQRIQLGSPQRLQLIFRQNVQTAYNAGRWEQMLQNRKSQPLWQYVAVLDQRTRPSHAALNGQVFRWDDPIWSTHYPPNGWNCRCRVRAMSERALKRRGLEVSSSEGRRQTRIDDAGRDYRTGEITRVEVTGVRTVGPDGKPTTFWTDPGFSYNAGAARYQPELDRYPEDIARSYVQGVVTGPEFERWTRIWRRVVEADTAGATTTAARRDAVRRITRSPSETRKAMDAAGLENVPAPAGMEHPVAVLRKSDMEALGTESQSVLMSTTTLVEHLAAHPEIGVDDYAKLPRLVEQGEVYEDGGSRILLLAIDGVTYRAAIKTDADRRRNYLLSLFRTTESQADKQVRGRYARIR